MSNPSVNEIVVCESPSFDPFANIALEGMLVGGCLSSQLIVFLWQNEPTVVIGKNQNPWIECAMDRLEEGGVHLARRRSGGGAVYHDAGNLNVSFISKGATFEGHVQTGIVMDAVSLAGIKNVQHARNDLEIDGRKFCGWASYSHKDVVCHHCCLMVDVDMEAMHRLLTPSAQKLASHGVPSVAARTMNLSDIVPSVSVETIRLNVKEALASTFGSFAQLSTEPLIRSAGLEKRRAMLSSRDWILGRWSKPENRGDCRLDHNSHSSSPSPKGCLYEQTIL